MPHVRTLTFTPSVVEREAVTLTSVANFDMPGLVYHMNRGSRPAYKFTLKFDALTKQQAESLSALHAVLQGGQSFYWDGGPFGVVDYSRLVGEGNGARREFFLSNRNVGSGSVSITTVRGAVSSAWLPNSANGWPYSLAPTAGLLTFANSSNTIPRSGDDVQAVWSCSYRCHFAPDGIRVLNEHRGVYSVELTIHETASTG